MFANAIKKAIPYTRPLMRVRRFHDGRTVFPLATLVVVNPDGWFVSVAHAWNDADLAVKHKPEIAAYEDHMCKIASNVGGKKKAAHKAAKVVANPNWVTHDVSRCLFLAEGKALDVADLTVDSFSDIAVGRLNGFDASLITSWPVFATGGTELPAGSMVCKLGFPFPMLGDVVAEVQGDQLSVHMGDLQLPYFPLEGMLTRTKVLVDDQDPAHKAEFLESSTPGIPGQSGGPWFDSEGTVWAIQSHTTTIDLGLVGKHQVGKRVDEVPQCLSIGHGISSARVTEALAARGIEFNKTA